MAERGWDEAGVALAFAFGGVAGLVSQAAIGAVVDAVRGKRALLVGALAVAAAGSFAIVLAPRFWPVAAVAAAGIAGALANAAVGTATAAVSLGVVGPARFARRAARSEALFHAGSAAVNLAIPARAIDHGIARGLLPGAEGGGRRPSSWRVLTACGSGCSGRCSRSWWPT